MNLIIPSTSKPSNGSFPTVPRKVRHWLTELYPVVSADSSRAVIRGLKHCNRLENSVRNRLEILELFRPVVRELIDYAVKQYTSQNLPLNVKEFNTFNMVHTLLQELAFGYMLTVIDSRARSVPGTAKILNTTLVLAMEALNEIALRHVQIYQSIPNYVWQNINHLYKIAEDAKITKRELSKNKKTPYELNNAEQLFISTHLLQLTQTQSLRRGQALQTHQFIATHCAKITLFTPQVRSINTKSTFAVDLQAASSATNLHFLNREKSDSIRAFDLNTYLEIIDAEIEKAPNSVSALYESDVLTRESLIRLRNALKVRKQRKYAREFCHQKLSILTGLKEIYALFQYKNQPAKPENATRQGVTFELKPDSLAKTPTDENEFITHPEFSHSQKEKGLWDAVATRRIATTQTVVSDNSELSAKFPNRGDWIQINRSISGTSLYWEGNRAPQITVGELVASRDFNGVSGSNWIISMVTWMQIDEKQKLFCGINHLAMNAKPILVERTKGSHNSVTTQTECLIATMLGEHAKSCIFVPAYMFYSNETIHFRQNKEILRFKLLKKLESTGSFTLFTLEFTGSSLTAEGLTGKILEEFGFAQTQENIQAQNGSQTS